MHARVYWNDEQCWQRKFYISLHKTFIFIFSNWVFLCEQEAQYELVQNISIKVVHHFCMSDDILVDDTNFLVISRILYGFLTI
jgi:hypothetical protein